MIDFVRRKGASSGITSRDWPTLSRVINKIIRSDNSVSPKDLIKAKKDYPFLKKHFEPTPEEATEELNMMKAKKIISSLNQDGNRAYVFNKSLKRFVPFFDQYDSSKEYQVESTIRNLRFAKATAPKDMKPLIETLLLKFTDHDD